MQWVRLYIYQSWYGLQDATKSQIKSNKSNLQTIPAAATKIKKSL